MTITIGIDPHKASHTAVAIDNAEHVLDQIRVRACSEQTAQLRCWAAPFPERVWAIESHAGSATCSLNNSSLRAKPWWTCQRCCPPELGCWDRAGRRRTTRTTLALLRSLRFATLDWDV